jgi:hypothetical protein
MRVSLLLLYHTISWIVPHQCFGGIVSFHMQFKRHISTLKMEAAHSSETFVPSPLPPPNRNLYNHRREYHKSHTNWLCNSVSHFCTRILLAQIPTTLNLWQSRSSHMKNVFDKLVGIVEMYLHKTIHICSTISTIDMFSALRHGASSRCGWRTRFPDMEDSCEL